MLNVFICCFSKQRPSKVCVHVSTATLPTKTISYENVDISASEHTQLENGGRKFEEAAGIVIRDCCEYVIKRPPYWFFSSFVCYLIQLKSLRRQKTLPFMQGWTSPIVKNDHPRRTHAFLIQRRIALLFKKLGLWLLTAVTGNCEIGCPVVNTPSQTSLLLKGIVNCEFYRLL